MVFLPAMDLRLVCVVPMAAACLAMRPPNEVAEDLSSAMF